MHDTSYKSALARRACRYSDARPPRKTDGVLLESEIPPHMRGKVACIGSHFRRLGITPAYAGKSSIGGSPRSQHWDHPRMCGEKEMLYRTKAGKWGSPSHMRGKANLECHRIVFDRITPAYAGKRPPQSPPSGQSRDHPRICGEKSVSKVETKLMPGLPPHMQEKGLRDVLVPKPLGITPAYAGKRHCQDGQQGDT